MKFHSLSPHANFSLFLAVEVNLKILINLFENLSDPDLIRAFATVLVIRMCGEPHERTQPWFGYMPYITRETRICTSGLIKKYEFNESDLGMACGRLDTKTVKDYTTN
uniref:Uncharacterized protein n=1 Tax=Amphimedon queenslandica TaxID=400682 RepID=A0A1X7U9L8_AMPQE